MAEVKISQLDPAASLDGTELVELAKTVSGSLAPRRATVAAIAALAAGSGGTVTALSISAGAVIIDLALGKSFTLLLTENVTGVSFSNLPAAGVAADIEIEITQDATGGRTFALPASFKALGGSDTAVASAANAVTVLSAKTFDQGTAWRYAMQESA